MDYRKHLQAFIDRWRYNANRAAQAQSKIKILEKVRISLFSDAVPDMPPQLPDLQPPEVEETEQFK
jgi:ATP-binding cassette subfamily F protein 3